MSDLSFAGYRSIVAGPDDPLRLKWNAVRFALDAPSIPIAPVPDLNITVNRKIVYQAEPAGVDVWQTPIQTWTKGSGDCEDFAILKYALLKATIPVRVVVGEIKKLGMGDLDGNRPHAWCAAYLANEWHALDCMFDQIIPIGEYINWLPIAAMHDDSVVLFGRQFTMNEILAGNNT
jgi:transglutaminase-like putative cysteine protease